MRVLMLSNRWPPLVLGGAERYASLLAAELVRAGHQLGVVTFGVDGEEVIAKIPTRGYDLASPAASSRVSRFMYQVRDLWSPRARAVLREAIETFRPDVVHSHAVAGFSVAALLTGTPTVHHLHDMWLLCRVPHSWRDATRHPMRVAKCRARAGSRRWLVCRRPPLFVAPSESIKAAHVAAGWPEQRCRVIRHPVLSMPSQPARDRTPPPPGRLRLGFIGQLESHKGFDLVLQALDELPDYRLVVAGDGPLRAAAVGHPRADYRGVVSAGDKERFFADVDLVLAPSRAAEVAGLVIDEAAVRGIPIIAARRGGMPEYVPPGCRSLLIDPDVPGALAAAIRRFAADPRAHPASPPAGRTWDEHTAQILAVYDEAIAETTSQRQDSV